MNNELAVIDSTTLTPSETTRLAELEAVVEHGMQTFVEVGIALGEIRDGRLYRATHGAFEQYLQDRWELGRSHGYRLIDAATTAKALSPVGDTPPNEAQARELAPLVRADPDRAAEVWAELRREHGNRLTASLIRDKVKALQVPVVPADRLERHPLSAILPDLTGSELLGLADSIRAHGLLNPIVLYMGQVLDGWQRYRACAIAGVEPHFTRYDGDDPFSYWASVNLIRANYTPEQVRAVEEAAAEMQLQAVFSDGDGSAE
jgi:ParB/Sulfiredoxin domain